MKTAGSTGTGVTIGALYRYPVKGLSAENLAEAELSTGEAIPFDRAYAIENGPGRFDPFQPRHVPKISFLTLMRDRRLADIETLFDASTGTLTILREGQKIVSGPLTTPAGRAILSQFFAEFMKTELRGPPRIVSAPGHAFADSAVKCLHIVSSTSLNELERRLSQPLDAMRFRPNLVLEGALAWAELGWIGKTLAIGSVRLEVFARTDRCAAANVDPATGRRNLDIPAALNRLYGHACFGVYARVTEPGTIRSGDSVSILA